MTRQAYVILGDAVASRDIEDRPAFRETMEAALDRTNERYADDLVGEFAFVKGVDEIAGVVRDPRNVYRMLRDVVSAARPGAIRFSVVHGEIDVGISGEAVGNMDGPAFHRADRLLAEVAEGDLYVAFEGKRPLVDPFVGASINLLLIAREDWTERQRAMVQAYEEAGTQNAVADRFGVSQQVVSATLRRADWPRISQIEAIVNDALAGYEPDGDRQGGSTEGDRRSEREVESGS